MVGATAAGPEGDRLTGPSRKSDVDVDSRQHGSEAADATVDSTRHERAGRVGRSFRRFSSRGEAVEPAPDVAPITKPPDGSPLVRGLRAFHGRWGAKPGDRVEIGPSEPRPRPRDGFRNRGLARSRADAIRPYREWAEAAADVASSAERHSSPDRPIRGLARLESRLADVAWLIHDPPLRLIDFPLVGLKVDPVKLDVRPLSACLAEHPELADAARAADEAVAKREAELTSLSEYLLARGTR